jgi:hypothetical protein
MEVNKKGRIFVINKLSLPLLAMLNDEKMSIRFVKVLISIEIELYPQYRFLNKKSKV